MYVFKVIYAVLIQMLIYGVLLFLPAGTIHWWRAWVVLGFLSAAALISMLTIFRHSQDLLEERFRGPIQPGQPLADKIIIALLLTSFCAQVVLIPLDVFRFHLLPKPPIIVSSIGLLVFIIGWIITAEALRENTFASPTVRLQAERNQRVIDTGLYGIIRHPMYAGGILLFIGMPLWLESYAATIFSIVLMAVILARIRLEEQFLRRELSGYEEYTCKVRHRLVPGVW